MPKYRFDGAFGTLYAGRGGSESICECANLSEPELVKELHLDYIRAGANAVKTNTYQANPVVLPDTYADVIKRGYELALGAAQTAAGQVEVFADIGNISAEPEIAEAAYLDAAGVFCNLGARNFLFETLDDVEPVLKAVAFIRDRTPEAAVILSFAVAQDGYTRLGRSCARLISRALEVADYAGMNCICGPSVMLGLASRLGELIPGFDYSRFSAMPNASYPSRQNGRMTFADNSDYFADKLSELAGLGAGSVGGCCGTTPEHIRKAYALIGSDGTAKRGICAAKPRRQVNFFADFDYSRKLIAVELNPPVSRDASFFTECAHRFVSAGADALTVTDSPLARVRADSLALSAKLKRELGVPVLPHLTCRDRNRIAIKSGLLAASMDGIDSLLAITGDSPDVGSRSDARFDGVKTVYNLNSYGLISYVDSLNSDVFADSPYSIAAALNVNAPNFAPELERAAKKLSLGAKMLMTQAIFTSESIENLRLAREVLPECRIFAGIMPLAGYKNAVFLSNEVGGITIPAELIESLRDTEPEEARRISLGFAQELIDRVWELCDGFYLMFPLKRAELAEALIGYIKGKQTK